MAWPARTDSVARLIENLEWVRKRPAMYFGAVEIEPADAWIAGFAHAISMLSEPRDYQEIRGAVVKSRGWDCSARRPSSVMTERGLGPAQVIEELLIIEQEALRCLARASE